MIKLNYKILTKIDFLEKTVKSVNRTKQLFPYNIRVRKKRLKNS